MMTLYSMSNQEKIYYTIKVSQDSIDKALLVIAITLGTIPVGGAIRIFIACAMGEISDDIIPLR